MPISKVVVKKNHDGVVSGAEREGSGMESIKIKKLNLDI
jgi:hypothetical protein